ncbi:hypothetical protein FHS27_006453 [Rhodopirellula rubra]|uniref:Uncharacterized protein n=1 Tax=Aporhodopirellula rubra TaxID=980271 RepID=A0A7W5E5J4_9BACT|nr:hypothetical protein [Aporhodopirellula rubra]
MQTNPRCVIGMRPGGPAELFQGLLSPVGVSSQTERPEGLTQGQFSKRIGKGCVGPPGLAASLSLLPGVGTPGSDCVGTPCLMFHVLNGREV